MAYEFTPEHKAAQAAGMLDGRRRTKAGEGFIYVAEVTGTDAIKIGFSLNPERRVQNMRPRGRLLGYFPASIKAERLFHLTYKHLRLDREQPPKWEHYQRDALMGRPPSLPADLMVTR